MVAANYAAQRSALAKSSGLGQLRKKPVAAVPVRADGSEAVVGVLASADTIEVVAPASIANSSAKRKAGRKVVAPPPAATVKRKPGRPRKAMA